MTEPVVGVSHGEIRRGEDYAVREGSGGVKGGGRFHCVHKKKEGEDSGFGKRN